ncbi:MAG: Mur ligase family protein, partial [Bacteroidota bacterium]
MNIRSEEIAKIVGGKLTGPPDVVIREVFIDSRKFFTPESSLFVAISGERNDGHDYIRELIRLGVRVFLVERIPETVKNAELVFILVQNSIDALQALGAWYRNNFKYPVLGITGSNGKTIVKEWIYQAAGEELHIVRSPQSYNSQVGVPLSLFLLDDNYNMAILEAGISKPGEMDRLQKMIRPVLGIMTNLGQAHQENFSSLREKAIEKLKLFIESDKIIYCADYPIVHQEARNIYPEYKLVSWGMSGDFDYYVTREISVHGSTIHFEGKISAIIQTPFVDLASIENCTHVVIFLFEQGYAPTFVQEAVLSLEPVSMRMEILKGSNQCTLINDSYNSDLVSVSNALDYLELQVQHDKNALIISDIFQSGISDKELYRTLAKMISKRAINRVIAVGEKISANRKYFHNETLFYPDTDSLLKDLPGYHFFDEAILLKGARKFEFERISSYLQESAHRTVMEIDLSALLDNYRYYKSILRPGVKIMAMVKAFSYGSGGYEIANLLEYQNIEYLAVAYTDEGVKLRKNGIKTPIMVMSPEKNDFPLLIEYNLEPEIFSLRI